MVWYQLSDSSWFGNLSAANETNGGRLGNEVVCFPSLSPVHPVHLGSRLASDGKGNYRGQRNRHGCCRGQPRWYVAQSLLSVSSLERDQSKQNRVFPCLSSLHLFTNNLFSRLLSMRAGYYVGRPTNFDGQKAPAPPAKKAVDEHVNAPVQGVPGACKYRSKCFLSDSRFFSLERV